MHVVVSGPSDGVPIVFLHGSMVAGWMWASQVEGLPEYRCLLPDLPGMGRSGDQEWKSLAETADRVAEMIGERCEAGSAHVVGLSLGGLVGLHLARRQPVRVRSLLVSGVPGSSVSGPLKLLNRLMLALYTQSWGAKMIGRLFGMPDEESMNAFVDTAANTSRTALERIVAEISSAPLPDGLELVETPTLVVVGGKDTQLALQTPSLLEQTMPNASGYSVEGVGHQWNAEQPELFTEMVRAWIPDQRVDPRLTPVGP